ncbi:hypothetical protein [Aureibacter tunicatorum]|uniref:Uncharacterized protein n=1 Tax=Aureibacter tunicatorum TaxID=866807 RepID=A0AAE3XL64_9BACT|nr:hypothetical protein [Aureibacter tunicatorum]MDR6237796.1 hypothetical protein [Aureibacter tunicatorum]BDD02831.1 hypothetical protein AUTU_03140 [Aureibacter tunicatorum]
MWILPYSTKTFVFEMSQMDVIHRIDQATLPFKEEIIDQSNEDKIQKKVFNGRVRKNGFRISQKLLQPNNSIPLMVGKVEKTSRGCLLFVKFVPFFSSLFVFSLVSLLLILTGAFFFYINKPVYGFSCLGIILLHVFSSFYQFNRLAKESTALLNQIFN